MRILFLKKSLLIKIAVCTALVIGAVIYTRIMAVDTQPTFKNGSEGKSGVFTGVTTDQKKVALTFDTAFGNDKTTDILKTLKDEKVKATFAVMGLWAQDNPQLLKQIAADGHQIISHSMTHERYTSLDEQAILKDAGIARSVIKEIAGTDTNMIRTPYGEADSRVVNTLSGAGYKVIGWSVDAKDWKKDGADKVEKRITDAIKPGGIIVLQNNTDDGYSALGVVIRKFRELGYTFVTVEELMK